MYIFFSVVGVYYELNYFNHKHIPIYYLFFYRRKPFKLLELYLIESLITYYEINRVSKDKIYFSK